MNEFKIIVMETLPFSELKKIVEAMELIGYSCFFVGDNGNLVFEKKVVD